MLRLLKRIAGDVIAGKNIEAYIVSMAALVIAVLSLVQDVVPQELQMAVILAALALLVFNMTQPERARVDLDDVLRDRESYGAFRDFIRGGSVLWVYGPSAVNVMNSAPDLEREILAKGGEIRILLQDPANRAAIDMLYKQLDQMSHLMLEGDIARSLVILKNLKKRHSKLQYRLLPFSPGFSLVVLDPHGKDGRAVVEMFGFNNQVITDRMHITIPRSESNYWFEYWARQFETMWQAGHEPEEEP